MSFKLQVLLKPTLGSTIYTGIWNQFIISIHNSLDKSQDFLFAMFHRILQFAPNFFVRNSCVDIINRFYSREHEVKTFAIIKWITQHRSHTRSQSRVLSTQIYYVCLVFVCLWIDTKYPKFCQLSKAKRVKVPVNMWCAHRLWRNLYLHWAFNAPNHMSWQSRSLVVFKALSKENLMLILRLEPENSKFTELVSI